MSSGSSRWSRFAMLGLASGLALALLVWWTWPGPSYSTSRVLQVRFEAPEVTRVAYDSEPGDAEPASTQAVPYRVPAFAALSLPAQRRFEWAHERAAWIDGGWVACDLTPLGDQAGGAAELIMDGRGHTGVVDLGTSAMAVHDGWLVFTVSEPSGDALFDLGGLFERRPVRISWTDALGEVPGTCAVETWQPAATLQVQVIEPVPLDGDLFDVWVVGCGRTDIQGRIELDEDAPCDLHVEVRNRLLPTQVSVGASVQVTPRAGQVVDVTVVAPLPPARWQLPRLDETLVLLDVAAFSGSEVLADHLDLVLDDLAEGRLDLDRFSAWTDAAWQAGTDPPDSAAEAIETTWAAWALLDEEGE